MFKKSSDTHNYATRFASADKLDVGRVNTKYGDRSFKVIGASKLNELKTTEIYKNANSRNTFLQSLKFGILETYSILFYLTFDYNS